MINKKNNSLFYIVFFVILYLFSFSSGGEEYLEKICLSLNDPEQYEQSFLKLQEIYITSEDPSVKDQVANIFFDLLKTTDHNDSLRILSFLSKEKGPDERIKKDLLSLLEKESENYLLLYSTLISLQHEKLNKDEMIFLIEYAKKKFISPSVEIQNRKMLELLYETIAISGRESSYDIIMDSLKKDAVISTALYDSLGYILALTKANDSYSVMIRELEEWYKRDPGKVILLIREGTSFLQDLARSDKDNKNTAMIEKWIKTLDDIVKYEENNNDIRMAASDELKKIVLLFPSLTPNYTSLPQKAITKEEIQSLPEYIELRDKYLDPASIYNTRQMVLKMYYSMNPKEKLIGKTILEEGLSSKNKTVKALSLNPPLSEDKSDYMKNILMEIILQDDDPTLVDSASKNIMNQSITKDDALLLLKRIKETKQKGIFDKYIQGVIYSSILKAVAHNVGRESFQDIMEFLNKNPDIDAGIKSNRFSILAETGHSDAVTLIMDDITTPLLGSYMEIDNILFCINQGLFNVINTNSCPREKYISLGKRFFGILNDLAKDEKRPEQIRILSCRYLACLSKYDKELGRISNPVLLRHKPLWKTSPEGDIITKIIENQ